MKHKKQIVYSWDKIFGIKFVKKSSRNAQLLKTNHAVIEVFWNGKFDIFGGKTKVSFEKIHKFFIK